MEKSNTRKVIDEHFKGLLFRKDILQKAGKIYKKEGEEATISFLMGKDEEAPPNFQPPAKTSIVAQSRPFNQWPIYQVSEAIQKRVFGYTEDEFYAQKKALFGEGGASSKSRDAWFKANGISDRGIVAQGLNMILGHAFARYEGVIQKVENRNKKRLDKLSKKNQLRVKEGLEVYEFTPESAFIDGSGLLAQPPGISPNIYGYQAIAPFVFDPDDPRDIVLPKEYEGYSRKPDDIIEKGPNRLDIPKGQPGYVPEHQRSGLKKGGRVWLYRRATTRAKALASILGVLQIGEDWVLFDMRGLLRNAYMRKALTPGKASARDLLGTFTEYPVLNARTGEFTFCYKLRSGGSLYARQVYKKGKTREILTELTSEGKTIALVTVDLGQRNPVAAMVARVSRDGELSESCIDPVSRFLLPEYYARQIQKYRDDFDAFRQEVWDEAFASMPPEYQEQIRQYEAYTPDQAKSLVLKHFFGDEVSLDDLPWEKMTSNTCYISNLYIKRGGDPSRVTFTPSPGKNSKKPRKPVKRTDSGISRLPEVRPGLPKDTRDAFEEAKWDVYRGHEKFPKLAKRVNQLCREIANWLEKEAGRITLCDTVVFGIEDMGAKFCGKGKGKFQETWEGFFRQKSENRWVMNLLKSSIHMRAHDKGRYVLELAPFYTSQRCPKCGYIHKNNRKGDRFECLSCGALLHADSEVATWNLAVVAILGKALKKPSLKCEKSSGQKKARTSRKIQIKVGNKAETSSSPQENGEVLAPPEENSGTSRDPVYNPSGT